MLINLSSPTQRVCQLTLNRPDAANALNTELAEALAGAFARLPANTRCIVLTGAGEKAFCAGADLKERQGMDEAAWERQHAALRAARDAILNAPVPVIAAVNGAAFGGGMELALAADFIYAAEHARFALTEARLGIMPGLGGVQMLVRATGEKRAREILLTGEPITAGLALAWGIVNGVFPAAQLLLAALSRAEIIASNAPLSIRAIRKSIHESETLAQELALYRELLSTKDRHEGIDAYNQKRKPNFTGN